MSFAGKVVIVTGASSGIGASTAVLFCKEGASVALVARNEAKLKKVSEQCTKAGGQHIVLKADVADNNDARRIINETVKKFGKLDILVNNAGKMGYGTILKETVLESYDKLIDVNLRAVVHLTMLAAPHLIKSKGNIVNISSVVGQKHLSPPFVAYCTTKAGLDHFTRGAALELAASGVRVNAISPGPVATDLLENSGSFVEVQELNHKTPLNRVSEPGEIGELILYVASDKARGITGSIILSDNGTLIGGI